MRVESDFAIAASQFLGLCKCQQPAAQTKALAGGGDGDIVQEQIVRRWQQHDDGGYRSTAGKRPRILSRLSICTLRRGCPEGVAGQALWNLTRICLHKRRFICVVPSETG
jgi:hypothetical protein